MTSSLVLRCPSVYTPPPTLQLSTIQPLSFDQLLGQWYINLTSSPAWQGKRNVLLTYSLLGANNQRSAPMDDLITYQSVTSSKVQTLHGTDTPSQTDPWAWTWRGNGLLRIATSHWEILGHGELEGWGQWIVVYAQKSIFTPAVVNVCTREKRGLPESLLDSIKQALGEFGQDSLQALIESMYIVQQD